MQDGACLNCRQRNKHCNFLTVDKTIPARTAAPCSALPQSGREAAQDPSSVPQATAFRSQPLIGGGADLDQAKLSRSSGTAQAVPPSRICPPPAETLAVRVGAADLGIPTTYFHHPQVDASAVLDDSVTCFDGLAFDWYTDLHWTDAFPVCNTDTSNATAAAHFDLFPSLGPWLSH